MAGLLTFYTLLSFAPTILAIYSIATLVLANNQQLVSELSADFITTYVPDEYRGTADGILGAVVGSPAGGVVGLAVGTVAALWSASAYVRAFSRRANDVYGQVEGRTLIRTFLTMLVTTVILIFGLVAILVSVMLNETVVNAFLGPIAGPLGLSGVLDYLLGVFLPVWRWVKWPVIVGVAVVLIALLFYAAPNVKQTRFRWLSVGAFVALMGLAVVSTGFYLYLAYFTALSAYGAVGTVMALIIALWGANGALILGMFVDAEVIRVRQLRAGMEAERAIQLPPRSTRQSDRTEAMRGRMEERGRDLRMRYLED